MKRTALSGFHTRSADERLETVAEITGLGQEDMSALRAGLDMDMADSLIENAIGTFALPLGVATNFRINGRDVLIPMVTEEPSVIAAASAGAKAARDLTAIAGASVLTGQIQVLDPEFGATGSVEARAGEIVDAANSFLSDRMSALRVTCMMPDIDDMIKVEIDVDTGEAMGANAVNTMCEGVAPLIEDITGGRVLLRILTNHMRNTTYATARFDVEESVAGDIVRAHRFAMTDISRAVTNNKGIMNGITAVGLATGQDTRALEAGAHVSAGTAGAGWHMYHPLSMWSVNDGRLVGQLFVPLQVGTVGGLTARHPAAAACLKMLGSPTAQGLAEIMAAVGLCQNFSALKALATDGIQKGHMKLHGRRLA